MKSTWTLVSFAVLFVNSPETVHPLGSAPRVAHVPRQWDPHAFTSLLLSISTWPTVSQLHQENVSVVDELPVPKNPNPDPVFSLKNTCWPPAVFERGPC